MRHEIMNLEEAIRDNVFAVNEPNAIMDYIISDQFAYGGFDSMDSAVSQLEMAHCAAGSFGGMIYTYDILKRLECSEWRDAIGEAWDQYCDATGESPNLGDSGDILCSLVTFAVDWFSSELASLIRCHEWYVVTDHENYERWAFSSYSDADDWIGAKAEELLDDWRSENPKHTEENAEEAWQQILEGFSIDRERL